MRFCYGIVAMGLWMFFLSYLIECGKVIDFDMLLTTTAIIGAGAMAGGK